MVFVWWAGLLVALSGGCGERPLAERPQLGPEASLEGALPGRARALVLDTPAASGPALVPLAQAIYAKRRAIVVGVDAYRAPFPRLEGAVSDAKRVAKAFAALGFDEVISLYDKDASRGALLSKLEDELGSRASPHDLVVVYFAGHGFTKNGQGYLVPSDASAGAIEDTALSVQRLKDAAFRVNALHVLYVVDACFSGSLFQKKPAAARTNPLSYWQALGEGRLVQVLAAGKQDEQALESSEGGAFTTAFVNGLAGAADSNHDGLVATTELGPYLEARVGAWSHGRQHPQWGNLEGDGAISLYRASPGSRKARPFPNGMESAFAPIREAIEGLRFAQAEEALRKLSLGSAEPEIYLWLADVYLRQDALGNQKLIEEELDRAAKRPLRTETREWLLELRVAVERARRGNL